MYTCSEKGLYHYCTVSVYPGVLRISLSELSTTIDDIVISTVVCSTNYESKDWLYEYTNQFHGERHGHSL